MNFVRRPESKRAPPLPEIGEKYKSLDAKLLRMKKKNKWESTQKRYSRMKQDKKNTWSWIREASVAEEEEISQVLFL